MKKNRFLPRHLLELLIAVLFLVQPVAALSDDTTASFEQPVPFGVAHSEDGSDIDVYRKPSGGRASGALHDYQICAVVSTEKLSGTTWYRINYFDDSGTEVSGYVMENSFYQLTAAGLVAVMSDPQAAAYIQQFSGLAMSANFVTPGESVTRSNTAAAPEQPLETEAPAQRQQSYVLNTNTMKFHYPSCSSVKDIKPSNRQDITGTRDEVVSMGYSPCGRCHP